MITRTLITAFPGALAKALAQHRLNTDRDARIWMLVSAEDVADPIRSPWALFTDQLPGHARKRITPLVGDLHGLDLGLSGADAQRPVEKHSRCILVHGTANHHRIHMGIGVMRGSDLLNASRNGTWRKPQTQIAQKEQDTDTQRESCKATPTHSETPLQPTTQSEGGDSHREPQSNRCEARE